MMKKALPVTLVMTALLLASPLASSVQAGKGGKGGGRNKPPVVTITSPTEGQVVRDPSLTVTGTITDDGTVASAEISVNSRAPAPLILDASGNFNASATMSPGVNLLEVMAADDAGKAVTAMRTVVHQPSSPEVVLISPADGDVIHAGRVDVVGTLKAPATRVDLGGFYRDTGGLPFHLPGHRLHEGANLITVQAVDEEGNRYETSVSVECTSTAVPLVLRADTDGGPSPLAVNFSLENFTGETITGWEMDYEGDGNFVFVEWGSGGAAHIYETGRLYTPEVRVTTAEGHHFSASTVFSVHGPAVFLDSISAGDPADLAVDEAGRLYVLERSSARVRVFDDGDIEIGAFGSRGVGPGQFMDPTGIGIDGAGMIYVTDRGSNKVVRFSKEWEPFDQWGYSGSKFGEMSLPEGLSVAHDGSVALADTGNSRVDWYRGHGYFESAGGVGRLTEPVDVAWTLTGDAAVADRGAGAVLLISKWSTLVKWQSGPGDFVTPSGVSYSETGQTLAVSDEGNDSVTLYKIGGGNVNFLRKIETLDGDGPGLLRPRAAVRRDHPTDEIFYIADTGHNRIVKVRLEQGPDHDPAVVWAGVRDALSAGNVEGALGHFSLWTKEAYRQTFADGAARMDEIVADMGEIHPLERDPLKAVYGLIRYDGDKPYLFHVVFARDAVGQEWKILYW